jgi:hypothetical protein
MPEPTRLPVKADKSSLDAVNYNVGMFEALAERGAGWDPSHFLAVERIEHQHGGRRSGLFEHRRAHADAVRARLEGYQFCAIEARPPNFSLIGS